MSRFVFKLPDLGEGTVEAEIVAWHVKPGDEVSEDDVLVEVMTEKAAVASAGAGHRENRRDHRAAGRHGCGGRGVGGAGNGGRCRRGNLRVRDDSVAAEWRRQQKPRRE